MRTLKLRHWKNADAGWFRDLDVQCFPAPDQSFFNSPQYHWWLLQRDDGWIIGYAGLYIGSKTGDAFFSRAGILPKFRGAGLQKLLIKARLAWCRRRGIKVVRTYTSPENHASIKNLKALGFKSRANKSGKYIHFRLAL